MRIKNNLFLTAVIIASGVFFAACGPQVPDQELTLNNATIDTLATDINLENTTLSTNSQEGSMKTLADFETIQATQVTLTTNKGDIVFEIYPDKVPLTTQNFLNLAKDGFYDGIVFHRVIEDFMAQAGDPLTKEEGKEGMWGSGGPGYVIADEFDPDLRHDGVGIVSMANRGPDTGGSQFFITYEATPWLDDKHAVFGKVTAGLDVLEQIEMGDIIEKVTFE